MGADRQGVAEVKEQARSGPAWAELVEAVPAAFYVDRIDGTSVWVSSRIESMVGLTEAEWASGYELWLERIHPEDRDRVVAANRRFLKRSGAPESDEYRIVLPDGRLRWIHDRALLLADAETGELLVHGVLVDVTEERVSLEVAERVRIALPDADRARPRGGDDRRRARRHPLPEPLDGTGGGAPAQVVRGPDAA